MEVEAQAVSVPASAHMELSIVECLGASLANSLDGQMYLAYHDSQLSIDSYFLDGIVLTYGSPCCHIWSFVAGSNQYRSDQNGCPCNSDSFSGTIPP